MTDFRAALKPRSGPKPGSEIKANTPAKVDFRLLLNKKDGSTKAPAATPAPEPEKNKTTAQNLTKPGPSIPQNKQSSINGVNEDTGDKRSNVPNKTTTEKKISGTDAKPTDNKEKTLEKTTPDANKKTNDGGIAENNNEKTVNGEKKGPGGPPVFLQPLCDVTVVDGERLRLECQVTSDPQAIITWILDGKVVKPSKFVLLSQEGEKCSLTVDKVQPEDEGSYTCRAENADGNAESSCVVTVDDPSDPSADKKNRKNSSSAPTTEKEPPTPLLASVKDDNPTHAAPAFSSVIQDVEVVEGSAARFDCKIEGFPDPEVMWYKDEQPIKETRRFQIGYEEDGHCSLVISEVCPDDDAKYTCKAVNSLGEASCTAELMVEFMQEEEEEEGDGEGDEEEQK